MIRIRLETWTDTHTCVFFKRCIALRRWPVVQKPWQGSLKPKQRTKHCPSLNQRQCLNQRQSLNQKRFPKAEARESANLMSLGLSIACLAMLPLTVGLSSGPANVLTLRLRMIMVVTVTMMMMMKLVRLLKLPVRLRLLAFFRTETPKQRLHLPMMLIKPGIAVSRLSSSSNMFESGDFTAPAASAPTTVDEDSQPDLRLDMDKNAETSPGLEPNTDLPHASDNTKTKTDEADESCDGGLTEMLENIMDQEQLDGHDSPKATEFCPNNDTAEADADSGASGGGGGDEAWPECILMPWSQTSLHQQAAAALLDQLKFILGKDVLQKQIDSWPVQLKIGTACSGTGAAEDALFCFVDALHLDEDLKIGKDFTANISFMVEKAKFKQKFLSCVHVDCFDQAGGGGCHLFNDVTCERMQCLIHRQCDDCASD